LRFQVAHSFEKTVHAVGDQLGHAAGIRPDGGHAARHGFQRRKPERLQLTGHQQHVRQRDEAFHVVLFSKKTDVILHAQLPRQHLGRPAVGTVAHHEQVRRCGFHDAR